MPAEWTPMSKIPPCDLVPEHGGVPPLAYADARLPYGSWGYVCIACFTRSRCSLGTGAGQVLVLRQRRMDCPLSDDQPNHTPGGVGCTCLLPEQMPAPPTPEEARYLDSADDDRPRPDMYGGTLDDTEAKPQPEQLEDFGLKHPNWLEGRQDDDLLRTQNALADAQQALAKAEDWKIASNAPDWGAEPDERIFPQCVQEGCLARYDGDHTAGQTGWFYPDDEPDELEDGHAHRLPGPPDE